MSELRERFQGLGEDLDRVEIPDLWDEAQRREPRSSGRPEYTRTRKALVIATAFALTIATTGIVIFAFHRQVGVEPVSGSSKNWPMGSVPQLGLSFRYPPRWHLQPFNENVGTVGFVGTLISNTSLVFHHPPVHNGATTDWDMRGLPEDGVAISIEHIAGPVLGQDPGLPDSPFPLNLAEAKIVQHLTKPSFTPPPGRSEERFLSFALDGRNDGVQVFFGTNASPQSRRAAAEVVASIESSAPATDVTWPKVIHASHPPVTKAFSKACPIKGGTFHMRPRVVLAGSTMRVSGPVYYRDEAGRFVWYKNEHPGAHYQAWWGLDPKNYASVAEKALSIAQGRPYEPSGTGPQMLGDDVPNGACSFTLRLTVPDVAAGTYPVSIVAIGGRGSTTYSWFTVDVSNASSP